MKVLKPSLREKNRYVLFKINGSSWEESKDEIIKKIKQFTGEYYYSISGTRVISNLCLKQYFVIKTQIQFIDLIKSSILFINKINDKTISIQSVLTSGTLSKIKSEKRN